MRRRSWASAWLQQLDRAIQHLVCDPSSWRSSDGEIIKNVVLWCIHELRRDSFIMSGLCWMSGVGLRRSGVILMCSVVILPHSDALVPFCHVSEAVLTSLVHCWMPRGNLRRSCVILVCSVLISVRVYACTRVRVYACARVHVYTCTWVHV